MRDLELSVQVINKMIVDSKKLMDEAITHENWWRAADLQSYIDGMKMALVVFGIDSETT